MEQATLSSHLFVPREAVKPRHFSAFTYDLTDSYTKEDITVETFDHQYHNWAFQRGDLGKLQKVFGRSVEIVDERVAAPFDFRLRWTKDPKKRLRENQRDPLHEWIKHGFGQLKAPARWGKTVWMTALMVKLRQRTLMLAHLVDLAHQLEETIREFTNINELEEELNVQLCGVVEDWSRKTKPYPITLSTYQRFAVSDTGRKVIKRWRDEFGLVIVDECHRCFSAGTLIDGRPIEDVSVGEYIHSYNHEAGRLEKQKVVQVFKHPVSDNRMCRITTSDGRIVSCTDDHPFWIGDRYVRAVDLRQGSVLYTAPCEEATDGNFPENVRDLRGDLHAEKLEQQDDADVLQRMSESEARAEPKDGCREMFPVQRGGDLSGEETLSDVLDGSRSRPSVLFGEVSDRCSEGFIREDRGISGRLQSEIRRVPYARKEPDVGSDGKRKSDDVTPLIRVETPSSRRERSRSDGAPNASGNGARVGNGGNCPHEEAKTGVSDALQAGCGERNFEDRGGSRRKFSLREAKESGREERSLLAPIRVVSVAVQERGSTELSEDMPGDGFVYNLEVEKNHNYFVEGILTHNCKTELYTEVVGRLNAAYRCGVTATPTRKDGMHVVVNDVLGPVIAEGYGEQLNVQWSWQNTGVTIAPFGNWATMWNRLVLKKRRNKKIAEKVVEDVRAGHFVLVTTERIAHIHTLKELIQEIDCDITVGELYGKTKNRESFRKAARRGEYQVVIAMNKIVELGYNIPRWSCFHNTLPMTNKENWYQRISRIRTPMEPAFPGDDWEKPQPLARIWCDYGQNATWAYRHCVKKENDRLGFVCLNPAPTRKKGKRRGLTGYQAEKKDDAG